MTRTLEQRWDRWRGVLERYLQEKEIDQEYGYYVEGSIDIWHTENASIYSKIGKLEYILYGSKRSYIENLTKSLKFSLELFVRYDNGEKQLSPGHSPSMDADQIFMCLAIGDFELLQSFFERTGDGDEDRFTDTFEMALGYCVANTFSDDLDMMAKCIKVLGEQCAKKDFKNFSGYPKMFSAIVAKDKSAAEAALAQIITEHEWECKHRGNRFLKDHEDLSTWGIGMANLSRYHGLDVTGDNDFVPDELLIG